jgi:uncharacterized membrane protein YagU involved in acid resistance
MWQRLLKGAIGGFTATVPMTAAMELGSDQLPNRERYPLPPRIITKQLAKTIGIRANLDDETTRTATILAHFGYGATMGAVYSVITPRPWIGPTTGIAFGMAVWAGSYLGALPALGILRPATEHPARRNLLMIGAHVVWGSALGTALHSMSRNEAEEDT